MAGPLRDAGRLLSIGIEIVVSTALGLALGVWLDRLTGLHPWLTILFLLLGIAAGFRALFIATGVLKRRPKARDND